MCIEASEKILRWRRGKHELEVCDGGHSLNPDWSMFVARAQPTAAGARQSAVSPGANYFMSGYQAGSSM